MYIVYISSIFISLGSNHIPLRQKRMHTGLIKGKELKI